ncbi:MAG TPA: hypothetical protein VFV95_13125 [Vicinamibacterales bacterium]|nr:hypothetical protein [Vicinamibacterales bacterium]
MFRSAVILGAITLSACSGGPHLTGPTGLPSTPPVSRSPSNVRGFLWAMGVDKSGVCIVDAVAEVIDGQRKGEKQVQETPCDVWSYGGGFGWHDLTLTETMTIRVSAQGYVSQEQTVLPQTAGTVDVFELPRSE